MKTTTNKILLGRTTEYGNVYLSKHSWDCDWYWGFGYLGNNNCHFHIKSMLQQEHDVTKLFSSTSLTQKQWWVIRDLFIQAYALKAASAVYRYGGHQSTLVGVTDCIKNKELEDKINSDLGKLLDVTWNYILECLQ